MSAPTHLPVGQLIDLPAEEYFDDRTAIRKGWLDLVDYSPAHLFSALAGNDVKVPTAATRVGRYLHCAVLEPDLLEALFYRQPPGTGKNNTITKADKDARAKAAEENPGKEAVPHREWALAETIRDAVYGNRAARAVMGADGGFEQSIVWLEDSTGEKCKARYDKVSTTKAFIADAKFVVDASRSAFERAIVNYRYDVQAHHYVEPTGLRFVFVAVEKTPPYAVAVYAASDEVMRYGEKRRLPNVRTIAECRASGKWPAYPDKIQRIGLPRWAR